MTKRVSVTLAICTLAGLGAALALFLPAKQTSTTAPAEPVAAQPEPATPAATPAAQVVNIEGFSFGGATVVQPGEQITVSNLDGASHTMTANDGSFDTGLIAGGASATLTMPTAPGTYQYFCSLHPSMVSTITVQS